MKLKYLLLAVLFFYCFNSFSQDGLKSLPANNGNSNLSMGGCNSWSYDISYSVFPPADSIIIRTSLHGPDTIYCSVLDSVVLDANWDFSECGPIEQAIWFKENIVIDTTYYTGLIFHAYRTFLQPGDYNCHIIGWNGFPHKYTRHIVIISTNSTTTGINEMNSGDELVLFPNPFSDKINITAKTNELVEINFFDVTGREILNQSFIKSTSINTEQLAKGIYIYEVSDKNGVVKKGKVVKE